MSTSCADQFNSLGIAKSPEQTRVVVAMSGGVDSSVVAADLARKGYDVIGITLQLYDQGAAIGKKGACCAGADIRDARRIAEQLTFPHYVLNYENVFRNDVIAEFVDSYLEGVTPIPCVRCNERVKFRDLLKTAYDLEADCMATGHYIRRVSGKHGPELHRANDLVRDQSYFLFTTTREQLNFLRFPLGDLPSKDDTRKLAQILGLSVANKPDSQDICFVPNGDYTSVIKKLRPEASGPGDIVHADGRILGQHNGIMHYTIGQRRGLDIGGLAKPLYVIGLDAATRTVTVGPKEMLETNHITVKQINWLGDTAFKSRREWTVFVKVRSTSPPVAAIVRPILDNKAEVELIQPECGIAPGQACVFYEAEGTRVFGGGWIVSCR